MLSACWPSSCAARFSPHAASASPHRPSRRPSFARGPLGSAPVPFLSPADADKRTPLVRPILFLLTRDQVGHDRRRRSYSTVVTPRPCLAPQAAPGYKNRMPASCRSHPKLRSCSCPRIAPSHANPSTAAISARLAEHHAAVSYLAELAVISSLPRCLWLMNPWFVDRIP